MWWYRKSQPLVLSLRLLVHPASFPPSTQSFTCLWLPGDETLERGCLARILGSQYTEHGPEEGGCNSLHSSLLLGSVTKEGVEGVLPRWVQGGAIWSTSDYNSSWSLLFLLEFTVTSPLPFMLPEHSPLISLIWAFNQYSLCWHLAVSLQCRFPGSPAKKTWVHISGKYFSHHNWCFINTW